MRRAREHRRVERWLAAVVLSGMPSSLVTVVEGGDLLESTRAAGAMLVGDDAPPARRLVAGAAAHLAISTMWFLVLDRFLPRRHRALWGAGAGAAIAALDLGVVGRHVPAIRRLPMGRQVADHIAFGVIAGWRSGSVDPVAREL